MIETLKKLDANIEHKIKHQSPEEAIKRLRELMTALMSFNKLISEAEARGSHEIAEMYRNKVDEIINSVNLIYKL